MKTIYNIITGLIISIALEIAVIACSSTKEKYTDISQGTEEAEMEKSGAQLWAETCNRCHLAPSPADYNDTDWETINLHMRIRANLAENEIRKIQEFLQSAN